ELGSQILYRLNGQIIGRPGGTHTSFSLIEVLPWEELLFEKQLRSLVDFFRLFQVRCSLFDFSPIEHILEIVGLSRDAKARSRLLIKRSLLIERQLQLDR